MPRWSLLSGIFPAALVALAVVGAAFLLARRNEHRWWVLTVPVIIVGAAVAVAVVAWYVDKVWRAFSDPLPATLLVAFGVIIAAVALAVARQFHTTWPYRIVAVVAAAAVVAASANAINRYYGYFPTVAAAVGQGAARQIPLPPRRPAAGAASTGQASGQASGEASGERPHWQPTGPLPATGAISEVTIPGTVSGFSARSAWVYLPPAYFAAPRPNLPVMVLIAGQFSNAKNWIVAGEAARTMDRYAARHDGLAPVVVMPDALGSTTGKQMCLDSTLGHVDTYLSRDVPDWITAHLNVDPDTKHWVIGGFSYGGTCAVTLAVAHPQLYPTFLDISGQLGPTLGSDQYTADQAFNGDVHAYRALLPLNVLAASERSGQQSAVWASLEGIFAVGEEDHEYGAQQKVVAAACRKAGMTVRAFTEPGTHSWTVAADALRDALPQLAARMGLPS